MDLIKQIEYLNPDTVDEEIHIIGCGAIGSTAANMLARMGFTYFHLYDFDTVEPKNVCNQTFYESDIGKKKVDAVAENMLRINDRIEINKHEEGWTEDTPMSGYVLLCVDSIELRKRIVVNNEYNQLITAIIDFRMGLTDAQTYAAVMANTKEVTKLKSTMNFTDEEAKETMPISACGSTLSVRPTVVAIVAAGIFNLMHIIKNGNYKTCILLDFNNFTLTAM